MTNGKAKKALRTEKTTMRKEIGDRETGKKRA
jgi:hypothetical protein